MAQDLWSLKEDGYLNIDLAAQNIVYHPALNILLVTTRNSTVHVLDVNSGYILQTSSLSAKPNTNIRCRYLEDQNKILFIDENGIGVRSDYNGVLLLDTVLQRRLKSPDEIVKLELLLSEAIMFQQSLKSIDLSCTDLHSEVLTEFTEKIIRAQSRPKPGIKAQKWNTVCLELKLSTLRGVAVRVLTELKRQGRHIPALAVAAAITERLSELAPRERILTWDRSAMFSEAKRRETFARWPHMDYKWALPEQMAQAGFYHQPNSSGDDRAMCFTCSVCLVCWERTDEPWSEHERHSPNCPFVKGEYTQNVPLSVTYATTPALDIAGNTSVTSGTLVAHTNVDNLIAFGHSGGTMVSVYNICGKLKRTHYFYITQDTQGNQNENNTQNVKRDNNVSLTSLCVVGEQKFGRSTPQHKLYSTNTNIKKPTSNSGSSGSQNNSNNTSTPEQVPTKKIRPSIICGVTVTHHITTNNNSFATVTSSSDEQEEPLIKALNDQNQQKNDAENRQPQQIAVKKCLYLMVYDFQYKSGACSFIGNDNCNGGVSDKSTNFYKKCSDILMTKLYNIDDNESNKSASIVPPPPTPPTSASGTGTTCSVASVPFVVYNDLSPKTYKNLVPNDNNSIFIPPPPPPTDTAKIEDEVQSQHNGPRIMSDETGVIYDSNFTDYSFTNGGLEDERLDEFNIGSSENSSNNTNTANTTTGVSTEATAPSTSSEKTISEHISEMKAAAAAATAASIESGVIISSKMVTYSHAVQCIKLPDNCQDKNLEILEIIPTKTGRHILVLLKQTDMTILGRSILLIYSLNFVRRVVKIDGDETNGPIVWRELAASERPEEITLLPLFDASSSSNSSSSSSSSSSSTVTGNNSGSEGLAAMVCADGAVRLIDLATLNIVSEAKTDGSRYVSLTYCNSLERLCVSTEAGPLHFYTINGRDSDFIEEKDEDEFVTSISPPILIPHNTDSSSIQSSQQNSLFINNTNTNLLQNNNPSVLHPINHNQSHQQQQTSTIFQQYSDRADEETLLIAASKSGDILTFSEMLNCRSTLTVKELQLLHNLCEFEPTSLSYCAVLPACWSEMQQCQRKTTQGTNDNNIQNSRIWRLQTDATTWDEHVIELTLPWSVCIGHVDLNFSLHVPCPSLPNIQVTLLKQNASGIGNRKLFTTNTATNNTTNTIDSQNKSIPVDDSIQFLFDQNQPTIPEISGDVNNINTNNSTMSVENPVLTEEYLRMHNVEILSGPINLSTCLDLSEQSGCVTFTSPQLLKARGRTLLIHIKALLDPTKDISNSNGIRSVNKDDKINTNISSTANSGGSGLKKTRSIHSSLWTVHNHSTGIGMGYQPQNSSINDSAATATRKLSMQSSSEAYFGCDWLHEISFAIRTMKQTNLPNERQQRSAVLESNHLIKILCECACRHGKDQSRLVQALSIDVLSWIATVRLGRHKNELGIQLLQCIEPHLYNLILAGLIEGTRSIAHKISKLLIVCIDNGRSMLSTSIWQQFNNMVLQALLRTSSGLGRINSASGLQWFTMLLQHVIITNSTGSTINNASIASAAAECLALIRLASQQLQTRTNDYHQLLRSRFGLYATPFDPELLDIEPPTFHKSSSFPVTFASVVAGDSYGQTSNNNNSNNNNHGGINGSQNNFYQQDNFFDFDNFDLKDLFLIPGTSWTTPQQASINNTNINESKAVNFPRSRGLVAANNHLRGLLETEPLHYTCASASEGTRIEKVLDSNNSNGNGNNASGNNAGSSVLNTTTLINGGAAAAAAAAVAAAAAANANSTPTIINSDGGSNDIMYYSTATVPNLISPIKICFNPTKTSNFIPNSTINSNNSKSQIINKNKNIIDPNMISADVSYYINTTDEKIILNEHIFKNNENEYNDGEKNNSNKKSLLDEQATNNAILFDLCQFTNSNSPPLISIKSISHSPPPPLPKKLDQIAKDNYALAWQHQLLLSLPQQILVIERMHSGARRYVVLDFGAPILLTDLLIPACNDLVSLSIDVWWLGEDVDCIRLASATDIGNKCLVLSDLQPPPLCRYLKITIIGRYGMSPTRCKIPVGNFYGHVIILPEDVYAYNNFEQLVADKNQIEVQNNLLQMLLEDINCRYTLSCSKLRDLLDPYLLNDDSSTQHMSNYLKSTVTNKNGGNGNCDNKIFNAYHECISYQYQLNIIKSIIRRLAFYLDREELNVYENESNYLTQASTDKLSAICESLLEVLLCVVYETQVDKTLFKYFNQNMCEELFMSLCVDHDVRLQLSTASLLVRMCGLQPWWGHFLATTLSRLYSTQNRSIFPQDRVFIILAYLCRKSLINGANRSQILDPILRNLCSLLQPLDSAQGLLVAAKTDLGLIGWFLLYLSLGLDSIKFEDATDDIASSSTQSHLNRWDWLTAEASVNRSPAQIRSADGYRKKLHKRFLHYKQQLDSLDYAQKAVQASTQALSAMSDHAANLSTKLEAALKQQEYFFKKMKQYSTKQFDDVTLKRLKHVDQQKKQRTNDTTQMQSTVQPILAQTSDSLAKHLIHEHCLAACRGLILLILNLDCSCNIDVFLLSCKTIARLIVAAKPALQLQQLVSQHQLVQLIRLAIRHEGGSQWISHAVTCLLQDMLESQKIASKSSGESTQFSTKLFDTSADDDVFTANSESKKNTTKHSVELPQFADKTFHDGSFTINNPDDMSPQAVSSPGTTNDNSYWLTVKESIVSTSSDILDLDVFLQLNHETESIVDNPKVTAISTVAAPTSTNHHIHHHSSSNNNNSGTTSIPLPSLPESDDSDLEDVLEDILEKKIPKKSDHKFNFIPVSSVSTATDARLEIGLDIKPEITLRRLTTYGSYHLPAVINGMLIVPPDYARGTFNDQWPNDLLHLPQQPLLTAISSTAAESIQMLTKCFDTLISDLEYSMSVNTLERIVQLWIAMSSFLSENHTQNNNVLNPSTIPGLTISPNALTQLIQTMTVLPSISLRAWTLIFQCLTLASNLPYPCEWKNNVSGGNNNSNGTTSTSTAPTCSNNDLEQSLNGLAGFIIKDVRFTQMLYRFFSGNGIILSDKKLAGPTVSQTLHDLLIRLQIRADVVTITSRLGCYLKNILLKLLYELIEPVTGPITIQQGPLDAQCEFVQVLLHLDFKNSDLTIIIQILKNLGFLLHSYMSRTECVKSISMAEQRNNQNHNFGNLFSSVLGINANKHGKPATYDNLIISILKLCTKLIQIPLPNADVDVIDQNESTSFTEPPSYRSSTSASQLEAENISQTDECKARDQNAARTTAGGMSSATTSSTSSTVTKVSCIADLMLEDISSMLRFCHTLNLCSDSSLAMLFDSVSDAWVPLANNTPSSEIGEPSSVSDALFQLMSTIGKKCTRTDLLLRAVLEFLTLSDRNGSIQGGCPPLSKPLVWWLLQVLGTENTLQEFTKHGGVQLIAKHLVQCYKAAVSSLQPATISQIMQYLSSGGNVHSSHLAYQGGTVNGKKMQQAFLELSEGLINFAPLGVITSTSPTAQSADVLIQTTIAPHRRARTPQWSYHFYPDENHVELYITLPAAVLLREVQLQPHLSSLPTCPSAVAIEVSRNGSAGLIPVCPPLPTSGMSFIRMHLPTPEVVTSVLIRLYKPRDSTNIGLLQIRLLGTAAFGSTTTTSSGFNKNIDNDDEAIYRSSLGWLRLLHQCINQPKSTQLAQSVVQQAAQVDNLLETCCGLLLVPNNYNHSALTPLFIGGGSTNLERVLLKLSLHDPNCSFRAIQMLLDNSCAFLQMSTASTTLYTVPTTRSVETVCELLYKLCTIQDSNTAQRVCAVLNWLCLSAERALSSMSNPSIVDSVSLRLPPNAAYLHCIASILWSAQQSTEITYDLKSLVTNELFEAIYGWTTLKTISLALKKALDAVLCAFCVINDTFFYLLLFKMDVLIPNLSTDRCASVSDDQKDTSISSPTISANNSCTNKIWDLNWHNQLVLRDLSTLHLTGEQLSTVAMACSSPTAVSQLLDSGLPKLLTQIVLQFCAKEQESKEIDHDFPMSQLQSIVNILNFFADMCFEVSMREWLGSANGSVFWTPLLRLLCYNRRCNTSASTQKSNKSYYRLEDATIRFLIKCCWGYAPNKQLLAMCLCDVIEYQQKISVDTTASGISGFTRRLILQLLLENEKVWVSIKADETIYKNISSYNSNASTVEFSPHPAFRTTNNHILLHLNTNTTLGEIFENHISFTFGSVNNLDASASMIDAQKEQPTTGGKDLKKDLWEVALDMADQISVAAGVTAKDKRIKDAKNLIWQTASVGASGSNNNTGGNVSGQKIDDFIMPDSKIRNNSMSSSMPMTEKKYFRCDQLLSLNGGAALLSNNVKLSQLLSQLNVQVIKLTVVQSKDSNNVTELTNDSCSTGNNDRMDSILHIFSVLGGLAILAEHLPLIYSDNIRTNNIVPSFNTTTTSAPTATNINYTVITNNNMGNSVVDAADTDWVKVDGSDDVHDEMDDYTSRGPTTPTRATSIAPNVPPHSLAAFALFLRLPGYAEMLLRDYKKAQCLLRLVLGVTDDGEGNDIFQLPIAHSLPTLPFQVLRQLYDATPITTDDSQLLRCTSINYGVIHLLLGCLSVFTHQTQEFPLPGNSKSANGYSGSQNDAVKVSVAAAAATAAAASSVNNNNATIINCSPTKTDDKAHLYWAKGTGFGTGSTQQSWNVEQALLRQRSEEEHVTVLLQVLSSYISPSGGDDLINSDVTDDDIGNNSDKTSSSSAHIEPPQPSKTTDEQLPSVFYQLLQQSCLLPVLCSYLRNDSVLDMARHIPLYRALLQLLRSIAMHRQLVSLLLPKNNSSNTDDSHQLHETTSSSSSNLCVVSLLSNMKLCVDTYASRLKINTKTGASNESSSPKAAKYNNNNKMHPFSTTTNSTKISSNYGCTMEDTNESDEGLALLIPDIQATADLVRQAAVQQGAYRTTNTDGGSDDEDIDSGNDEKDGTSSSKNSKLNTLSNRKLSLERSSFKQSLEFRYLEIMKKLQFDTYEMIRECSELEGGGYQFVVSYHFESNVKAAGDRSHPARVKRLAQEAVTLATSLPLSYSSSVFVRCDTDRLDVMKVLITGPADTPYANGCFELDVYFPPDYPQAPMMINLETTGRHTVRFNPNLYNDGKVCLSVLNTWHGRPEEKWNAQTSSFLQVLVSIQSLILVPEPYFNEPGYERSRGTPTGTQSSLEYNANIYTATVRWAMLEQIRNPCPCFKQVIHTHFWLKRHEIIAQIERWIAELESISPDKRSTAGTRASTRRIPAVSALALKHHYIQLYEELTRLKTPEGLEDLEEISNMDNLKPLAVNVFKSNTLDKTFPSMVFPLTPITTNNNITNTTTTTTTIESVPTPTPLITAASGSGTSDVNNDIDTDIEMEKMVSKVCE